MDIAVKLTFLVCAAWGALLGFLLFYLRSSLSSYTKAFMYMLAFVACISLYFKGGMLAVYYQDLIDLIGRDRFFLNQDAQYKWYVGMIVATVLVSVLVFSMILLDWAGGTPALDAWKPSSYSYLDYRTDTYAIWIATILSILAVVFLASQIGFDVLLADLSGKRKPLENIWLYMGIKFAFFARMAALYALMHAFLGRGTMSTKTCAALLLICVIVSSAFVSQRGYLFALLFEVFLLAKICGVRIDLRLIGGIALGLAGLLYVSIARMGDRFDGIDNAWFLILGSLLEGRYLFDITKIGGIGLWFIENDFANRTSALNWLAYPFMDVEIWRDTGPFIAQTIFGIQNSGVTQGLALEMVILWSGLGVVACYSLAVISVAFIVMIFTYGSKLLGPYMGNKYYPLFQALLFGKFLMMFNSAMGTAFFSIAVDLAYIALLLALLKFSMILARTSQPNARQLSNFNAKFG